MKLLQYWESLLNFQFNPLVTASGKTRWQNLKVTVVMNAVTFFKRLEYLLSLYEKESAILIQILEEAICVFLCANALGKGMNPPVIPSARGKS